MDHLPVFLDLRERTALVVGGGALAARKATLIARSGCQLRVRARHIGPAMRRLAAAEPRLQLQPGQFSEADLDGVALVLSASGDDATDTAVYRAASARSLPVNVADRPAQCSYILPAIVDRSPVLVAVSTGGRSPVLARLVKSLLERALSPALGPFAELLARWRAPVRERLGDDRQRRRFWEQLIFGAAGAQALDGELERAEQLLARALAGSGEAAAATAQLTQVGVAAQAPDLISLRAHRALCAAELVIHDRRCPDATLELVRREAAVLRHDPLDEQATWRALHRALSAGQRVVWLSASAPALDDRASAACRGRASGAQLAVLPPVSEGAAPAAGRAA